MGDRRMFTKKVTDDDNFMSLSASAQALYLHLVMSCDDDGFTNQVSLSMFRSHASIEDLRQLLEKRYVYQFENGVIVIKHFRMANALRKDRYTPTVYQEELSKLGLKDNGSYTWLPNGCQMVAERLPQDKLSKDKISKDNKRLVHPSVDDVREYIDQMGYSFSPESFVDYYEANGWKVGRNPMKDWKAACRQWQRRRNEKKDEDRKVKQNDFTKFDQRSYDYDDLESRMAKKK